MPDEMNGKEIYIFFILKCQIDFTSSWHNLYILLLFFFFFLSIALILQPVNVSAAYSKPEHLSKPQALYTLTSLATHQFHSDCTSAVIRHMLPVGFPSTLGSPEHGRNPLFFRREQLKGT